VLIVLRFLQNMISLILILLGVLISNQETRIKRASMIPGLKFTLLDPNSIDNMTSRLIRRRFKIRIIFSRLKYFLFQVFNRNTLIILIDVPFYFESKIAVSNMDHWIIDYLEVFVFLRLILILQIIRLSSILGSFKGRILC
jgi:hypothetical protein